MGWELALSAIGTGISAIGAIGQGQAAKQQAEYQAQVARNNAIIANQNANYATAAGEALAADEAMKGRARAGEVRAALAAGGIDVNTGSAADVRQTAAELGQIDLERVRQDAARRSYGYRSQSTSFAAQAGLDKLAGKNAGTAGLLRAGGILFAGGSGLIGSKFGGGSSTSTSSGFDPGGYYQDTFGAVI